MIQQESNGKQFSDPVGGPWSAHAINPNWSSDRQRGVGLGQLTNPAPSDGDMWNWRINTRDLQQRFMEARRSAARFHTRLQGSARFSNEAKAINDWRRAEGLPPIVATMPALTADQQDKEALRSYNGLGRRLQSEYLGYLHEFEPVTSNLVSTKRTGPDGKPLKSPALPAVDARGIGSWRQIDGAERRRRAGAAGDPDYVAHVLSRQG